MIQNSSRARRFEVEDSRISVRESVAYSSLCRESAFAASLPALFVREVPTSQTSHNNSGGTATRSASVNGEIDPAQLDRPASKIVALTIPFPTFIEASPCD
jgi:hypothetical protein